MSKRNKRNRKGTNRRAAALAAAQPSEPASGRRHAIGFVGKAAGVKVTEHNALTLAPVWACVRVITDALSTLPLKTYRRASGGKRVEAADDPVDWLLQVQANPETPAFFWRETMLAWALTWGNGYSEIERDGAGRPVWLHQLAPDRVMPDRTTSGRLVYVVANPRQADTVLDAADMLHLHGLGFDALQGYSVVGMMSKSIGLGLALEEYAGSFFANDATPGGALMHPRKLSEPAFQHLRETFEGRHRGPSKGKRMAILEEGVTFIPFSIPNNEAQFLESRNYSIPEMCRIFKVPPHKVMDLSRATFSNIEEQEIEFVVDCLHPWAGRLEAECNVKLFGRNNRGTLFIQHDFTGRLRGNVEARGVFNHQMLGDGVFSINDVLIREGLNPIGPIGDQRFIPLNMQPLDQASEPKPVPTAPGTPPAKGPAQRPKPESDSPPDGPTPPDLRSLPVDTVRSAMLGVFEEATGRSMRRGEHRLEDARKRLTGDALDRWCDSFVSDHRQYIFDALESPISAIASLCGRDAGSAFHACHLRVRQFSADVSPRLAGRDAPGAIFGNVNDQADSLLEACMFALYSDDQPRDEHGQFGETGGAGDKGADKAPAETVTKTSGSKGKLADGTEVKFIPHEKQRRDEVTVMVSAKGLDKAWSKDGGYYIGAGKEGIPGRREGFETFLQSGKPVQASRATMDHDGTVSFIDGRHRFAVLRDKGIDRHAVTVPRNQRAQFEGLSVRSYHAKDAA